MSLKNGLRKSPTANRRINVVYSGGAGGAPVVFATMSPPMKTFPTLILFSTISPIALMVASDLLVVEPNAVLVGLGEEIIPIQKMQTVTHFRARLPGTLSMTILLDFMMISKLGLVSIK
jgi:hypothetical protein